MTDAIDSFRRQTWKRFTKNKAALVGLYFILFSAFVAIFAYSLAPDNTPNADLQTVEIQGKSPGYTQLFLKIPAGNQQVSFLHQWFAGAPSNERWLPINDYTITGDSIIVHKYVDEDTTIQQKFSIHQITQGHSERLEHCITRKTFWLGTDLLGRDVLSRLIIGTRVSLLVGLIAVIISLTLGIFLGALAGYYRGRIDGVIMWLVNVAWSIPTLLLVFAITMAMGKGFWQIFIAVGLTMWVNVTRLIRGQVIAVKELEYIDAAKTMGFSASRIITRHILPNISGPVMVMAAGNFATAIIIEAGLSFLGIGIRSPQPSWGLMIKENYAFIITHHPMQAFIPGIAIMLLVLSFNLLGNGLRDALDVRS